MTSSFSVLSNFSGTDQKVTTSLYVLNKVALNVTLGLGIIIPQVVSRRPLFLFLNYVPQL